MERKKWDRWTPEKVAVLRDMLLSGKTLDECAAIMGVKNRQAICKIRMKYLPDLKREEYGGGIRIRQQKMDRERQRQEQRNEEAAVKAVEYQRRFGRDTLQHTGLTDVQKAQAKAFRHKKNNAKQNGIEFTILPSDIEWATHCPILGIELDWLSVRRKEDSPEFDRIDPAKGYVPGNVAILSKRANRIKNDGTAEEHRKIFEWLAQKQKVVVQ